MSSTTLLFGQNVKQDVLNQIKIRAKETHSDAVIILKDNQIIYKDFFGKKEKPIYIASAGKSLVNLAIGKLLDKKLLDSIDQPVYTFYPEWKQGEKKNITVRMLLNHTSGLQNYPNASIELEPAPTYNVKNIIKLALAAELSGKPGTKVSYNNKAVALLGGIVEKASGKRFDHFFVDEFYKPMNIADYQWIQDRSGNPTTHGAFVIRPSDLLKFGRLMLNKGIYQSKRLLQESWIDQSFAQGQDITPIWGLLWWRLPTYEKRIIDDNIWNSWKEANVSTSFLKKMKPLRNKLFEDKYEYYTTLEKILGDNWIEQLNSEIPTDVEVSKRIYGQKIIAYYADGYRGNYLVIIPDKNLVAVRCADHENFNYKTDFFQNFVELVARLSD